MTERKRCSEANLITLCSSGTSDMSSIDSDELLDHWEPILDVFWGPHSPRTSRPSPGLDMSFRCPFWFHDGVMWRSTRGLCRKLDDLCVSKNEPADVMDAMVTAMKYLAEICVSRQCSAHAWTRVKYHNDQDRSCHGPWCALGSAVRCLVVVVQRARARALTVRLLAAGLDGHMATRQEPRRRRAHLWPER